MARQRINPFATGTAERVLFDRYLKAKRAAEAAERGAALAATEGQAYRAAAERYATALRALGHGDKVTPLVAIPHFGEQ